MKYNHAQYGGPHVKDAIDYARLMKSKISNTQFLDPSKKGQALKQIEFILTFNDRTPVGIAIAEKRKLHDNFELDLENYKRKGLVMDGGIAEKRENARPFYQPSRTRVSQPTNRAFFQAPKTEKATETHEQYVRRLLSALPNDGGQESWQISLQKLRQYVEKRDMNPRQWEDAWKKMTMIEQEMNERPRAGSAYQPFVEKPRGQENGAFSIKEWQGLSETLIATRLQMKPLSELRVLIDCLNNIDDSHHFALGQFSSWCSRNLMDDGDWNEFARIVKKYADSFQKSSPLPAREALKEHMEILLATISNTPAYRVLLSGYASSFETATEELEQQLKRFPSEPISSVMWEFNKIEHTLATIFKSLNIVYEPFTGASGGQRESEAPACASQEDIKALVQRLKDIRTPFGGLNDKQSKIMYYDIYALNNSLLNKLPVSPADFARIKNYVGILETTPATLRGNLGLRYLGMAPNDDVFPIKPNEPPTLSPAPAREALQTQMRSLRKAVLNISSSKTSVHEDVILSEAVKKLERWIIMIPSEPGPILLKTFATLEGEIIPILNKFKVPYNPSTGASGGHLVSETPTYAPLDDVIDLKVRMEVIYAKGGIGGTNLSNLRFNINNKFHNMAAMPSDVFDQINSDVMGFEKLISQRAKSYDESF